MNPVAIAVCYRYSIEFGGRVLKEIAALMRGRGIVAVHLEVDGQNEPARAAYGRAGFSRRDKYHVMSLELVQPKS